MEFYYSNFFSKLLIVFILFSLVWKNVEYFYSLPLPHCATAMCNSLSCDVTMYCYIYVLLMNSTGFPVSKLVQLKMFDYGICYLCYVKGKLESLLIR